MKSIRLLTLLAAATFLSAGPAPGSELLFSELIVFGHSYCDNGNDFLLSDGIAAAPPYFGGRFSNGPLWVEHLAEHLGFGTPTETNPVPIPAEAGGTCYAYGGAATGDGLSSACIGVGQNKVCAPNVGLQIEDFFADGRTLDGDELIVIQAGDNDESPKQAAINIGKHVSTLAAAGGKTFFIPNLGRLSSIPGKIAAAPADDDFVEKFNTRLAEELDEVETLFNNTITIYRFDLLSIHDNMIAHPEDYAFDNIADPACPACGPGAVDPEVAPNPDAFLYWDAFHFSAAAHKFIGDQAAALILD